MIITVLEGQMLEDKYSVYIPFIDSDVRLKYINNVFCISTHV